MMFEFGPYRIDVDVERTRRWYETAPVPSQCCTCDGCANYEQASQLFPESVTAFFAALGVDVKKPIEVYVNCTNRDGTLFYGGWYHLCGTLLEDGEDTWQVAEGAPFGPRGFQFYPGGFGPVPKSFPEPVLELSIFADVPWVLDKENTYDVDTL